MDGEVDISSESITDKEAVKKDEGENQRSQLVIANHQVGAQSKHPSSVHATNAQEYEKENNVKDLTTKMGNAHKDGLQELINIAEQFQPEESRKCEEEAEVTTTADDNMKQSHIQEKQSDIFLEGGDSSKPSQEEINSVVPKVDELISGSGSAQFKSEKANTSVDRKTTASYKQKSKKSQNSNSLSKGIPEATTGNNMATNTKCKKNAGEVRHAESAHSNISLRRTSTPKSARTNFTVPQPFALATDKRASIGVRPINGDIAGTAERHTNANNSTSASVLKKTQLVENTPSHPLCSKSFPSESLKLENQNVKPAIQADSNHDDEDNCSIASSTSSSRKAIKERPKSAASGPSLRCDERAKKRKDFYSKLEEKIHAKEMEKSKLQLKSKEKQEAEIKQLRKSMTFKATPMPDFYHEAALPKVELKKIPPTRAKSPKLGRRNSCVGIESEGDCGQSSTSSCSIPIKNISNGAIEDITEEMNADKDFAKDNASSKKTTRKSLTKVPSEKQLLKSNLDDMSISPKQQDLNSLETKSAKELTEIGNLTTSRMSNTSTDASDGERINLQGSQPVKDDSEPSNGHNEIAGGMINKNQPRADEGRLIALETDVIGEKVSSEPLAQHDEIFNNIKLRELYEDAINLRDSLAVKGKDGNQILNSDIEVAEVKINRDELGESASLVATVKDTANCNGKSADDVQVSDTSKSKRNGSKVSVGSKVHKKEKIQCNGAVVSGTKSRSVRSSQEGSARESLETNAKGNQNLGQDRTKTMTSSNPKSKREGVKAVPSKRTGKGCNSMAEVVGDVLVQS